MTVPLHLCQFVPLGGAEWADAVAGTAANARVVPASAARRPHVPRIDMHHLPVRVAKVLRGLHSAGGAPIGPGSYLRPLGPWSYSPRLALRPWGTFAPEWRRFFRPSTSCAA